MKKSSFKYISFFILFLAFTFPAICAEGVRLGLDILFCSFIPAILPLLLYSNYLLISNTSYVICEIVHPIFHKLFKTSKKGSYAILMGFLCGYPLGTKILCDLMHKKEISSEEAKYLFKFINNPSPAFIQGYIFSMFNISFTQRITLMFCTYLPSIFIGLYLSKHQQTFISLSADTDSTLPLSKVIDDSISNAFFTILRISGYLIIFSIISIFIQKIYVFSDTIKCILLCFLEITSGTHFLSALLLPESIKILLAIVFSILGGMSIFFQIKSVSCGAEINMSDYVKYKLISVLIFIILYFASYSLF